MFGECGPYAGYEVKSEHADVSKRAQTRACAPEQANEVIGEVHEFLLVGAAPIGIAIQQRCITRITSFFERILRKGL